MDLEDEVESEIERQIKSYRDKIERLEGERAIAQGQTTAFPTFENVVPASVRVVQEPKSPPPPPPPPLPRSTVIEDINYDYDSDVGDNDDDDFRPLYDFFVFVANQRLQKNEMVILSETTFC
jgi:hypothetical protein